VWWIAGGGAALAVAATVAVVAATVGPHQPAVERPQPVAPSSTSPGGESPTTASSGPVTSAPHAAPVYYVGGPPEHPVLYREFHQVTAGDALDRAIGELMAPPKDPDYRSLWPAGSLGPPEVRGDVLTVPITDPALRTRPASMSEQEAAAAIQQVVYTAQAAVGSRSPVQITLDGNPIDQVYGVPTAEPLANAPLLDTLSLVNLVTPEEGMNVGGGSLAVAGVANSFEANVPWLLEDSGGKVVAQGAFTAQGWMAEKLFPFEGSIDVSSLDPGRYTLIVRTDDPSGGAEGSGASEDTRTVVID
jgi:hypothetical protein